MTTMTTDATKSPSMRAAEAVAMVEFLVFALAERQDPEGEAIDAIIGTLTAHRNALIAMPPIECLGLTMDNECWERITESCAEVESHLATVLKDKELLTDDRRAIAGARLGLAVVRGWFEAQVGYRRIRRRQRK